MRRHLFLLGVALLILVSTAVPTPALSQASGQPEVTLSHQYKVNRYGFGILNDTVTFQNLGNSTVQIPTVQVGIPDSIASRSTPLKLDSSDQYTFSKSELNRTAVYTVSAVHATLQPHGQSKFSLKSFVRSVINTTAASGGKTKSFMLLMTSPSLNLQVSSAKLLITLPLSVTLTRPPAGFSNGNNNSIPFSQLTQKNVVPAASASYYEFTAGDTSSFSPLEVFSVVRTITASALAKPQVSDRIAFKNLATSPLTSLRLTLLSSNITSVVVIPSNQPPLVNPAAVAFGGTLQFTRLPFPGAVQPGNNFTFTILYDLPPRFVKVSGNTIRTSIPSIPPIPGVIDDFEIRLSLPKGLTSSNSTGVSLLNATPLDQHSVNFGYTVALGWAAEQAVPFASLLFAAGFIALFAYRGAPAELKMKKGEVGGVGAGEEEPMGPLLSDTIKAFESKIAMLNEIMDELSSSQPSSIGREDFNEMRNRLDSARSRALQRLNEAKLKAGSKRLYDLLSLIHDSERDVDRASRDVINLYEQYYSKRMREETFKRLFPSYKRRLDTAINLLSDRLNTAQREGKL